MSLDYTLRRAAQDMERGDLGRARDRLEGLTVTYPDALEIRRQLGEIYWRLQYPERAGRHWYLLPTERPEMDEAKRSFERRQGGDAWRMLYDIQYRGGIESIRGTYAGDVIDDLARRARLSDRKLEAALRRREPKRRGAVNQPSWKNDVLQAACTAALVAVIALLLIGVGTVIGWLS